jgi:hypothetical protein
VLRGGAHLKLKSGLQAWSVRWGCSMYGRWAGTLGLNFINTPRNWKEMRITSCAETLLGHVPNYRMSHKLINIFKLLQKMYLWTDFIEKKKTLDEWLFRKNLWDYHDFLLQENNTSNVECARGRQNRSSLWICARTHTNIHKHPHTVIPWRGGAGNCKYTNG